MSSNNFNNHRLLTKRKLDDYDHATSRKSSKGKSAILHRGESSRGGGGGGEETNEVLSSYDVWPPRLQLQFFVKMISGGKTLVLQANLGDTVEEVHRRIEAITGVPMVEQRLIYRGKQLYWEQTMEQCGVQNDAGLQLVGRMRSTDHPRAWRVISDLVSLVCKVCRNDVPPMFEYGLVKSKLDQFMALPLAKGNPDCALFINRIASKNAKRKSGIGEDEDGEEGGEEVGEGEIKKSDFYNIFMDACAPKALVMMYMSAEKGSQNCADDCIRSFVSFVKDLEGDRSERACCAKTVLEFCRLLKMSVKAAEDNLLYVHCRSALGSMLEKVEVARRGSGDFSRVKGEAGFVAVEDVFLFLKEVGERLVKDLELSADANANIGPLHRDVCDFSAFLQPMLGFIGSALAEAASAHKGKGKGKAKVTPLGDEVDRLFYLFTELLTGIDKCLGNMELCLALRKKKDMEAHRCGWSQYLVILKELISIAVLYPGSEDRFWKVMSRNKVAVCGLVVRYANRADDYAWLLKQKDLLDFESRRHLAMLMFPEVREDYEELHEMLIDRSQLLAESFEYISRASPSSLHAGLFMEFKNEEATGPGVLREWFCLVCQAIFDPQNALFVACPLDRRRFFPNPASKVHPLHLQYFQFSGRVIALALMHKIQVGIVLDRVLFLQLAGKQVTMDDIQDADPCIYNSCKQILEMDPEFVDSDGLGLTFSTEVEELGSIKDVELRPGGKQIVVDSKNRKEYVNLIVQHRFVTSIAEQVSSFGQGFAEILREGKLRETFFESLEREDLDWMLHGSGDEISVEDWKAHTEYSGYKKSDPQIVWFWEVVGQLNADQKKTLLFFWTSVKYLPVEGFRGLASRVYIYKSLEPQDHLPSSHTCFYRLCIPSYPTKAVMRARLRVITQEHVGCSFGTS